MAEWPRGNGSLLISGQPPLPSPLQSHNPHRHTTFSHYGAAEKLIPARVSSSPLVRKSGGWTQSAAMSEWDPLSRARTGQRYGLISFWSPFHFGAQQGVRKKGRKKWPPVTRENRGQKNNKENDVGLVFFTFLFHNRGHFSLCGCVEFGKDILCPIIATKTLY